jgi:hypothetical protein
MQKHVTSFEDHSKTALLKSDEILQVQGEETQEFGDCSLPFIFANQRFILLDGLNDTQTTPNDTKTQPKRRQDDIQTTPR